MCPQDVKTQNVKKQPLWHIIPYIAPEFQSFRSNETQNRTHSKTDGHTPNPKKRRMAGNTATHIDKV